MLYLADSIDLMIWAGHVPAFFPRMRASH